MKRWGCLVAVAAVLAGGATTVAAARTSLGAAEAGTDHPTDLEQPQTRWAHTALPPRPGRQPARPRCKRSEIAFGAPGEMKFCHPFRVSTFKASLSGEVISQWKYPRQWHGVVGCYTHYFSGRGAARESWTNRRPGTFVLNAPPGGLERALGRTPPPVVRLIGASAEQTTVEYTNTCGFENYTRDTSPDCGPASEDRSGFSLSLAWDEGVPIGIALRHPGRVAMTCNPGPPLPDALITRVPWGRLNDCKTPTINAGGAKTIPWPDANDPTDVVTGETRVTWKLMLQRLRCARAS